MSINVPPKTDQDVPPPHRRTLPHFPVNEEGMRELEIWIKDLLGFGGKGFIRYVFKNIGKWLWVSTTSTRAIDDPLNLFSASQYFVDKSTAGNGIILAIRGPNRHPEWGLTEGGLIGYLNGSNDTLYTQGGDIVRYTASGEFIVDTGTDGLGNNTVGGPFIVYTRGTGSSAAAQFYVGSSYFLVETEDAGHGIISFQVIADDFTEAMHLFNISGDDTSFVVKDTTSGAEMLRVDGNGDITVTADASVGTLTLSGAGSGVVVNGDSVTVNALANDLVENLGASGVVNILNAGQTYVVKDHSGNPLVTYTG